MAIYQVTTKEKDGRLENTTVKAANTEEALKKFLEDYKLKDIAHVKFLFSEDDSEEVIKEIAIELTALFLDLHHLGHVGYTISSDLCNGNEIHRTSRQWEIRALMDTIKERSEQIYGLLDALLNILEDRILEE